MRCADRKAAGHCVTCDDPRGDDGTSIRCRPCADYTNEQSMMGKRRRRALQPKRERTPRSMPELRLVRRAASLCVSGGPDHAAAPGRSMCAAHAEHRKDLARARYAQRVAA